MTTDQFVELLRHTPVNMVIPLHELLDKIRAREVDGTIDHIPWVAKVAGSRIVETTTQDAAEVLALLIMAYAAHVTNMHLQYKVADLFANR